MAEFEMRNDDASIFVKEDESPTIGKTVIEINSELYINMKLPVKMVNWEQEKLKKIKTCELFEELKCREGVNVITAEPYERKEIIIEGPAVVLIIVD